MYEQIVNEYFDRCVQSRGVLAQRVTLRAVDQPIRLHDEFSPGTHSKARQLGDDPSALRRRLERRGPTLDSLQDRLGVGLGAPCDEGNDLFEVADGDLNPRALIMAVVFGASCCFANPLGYQTNLMVFGPGGYRFRDFVKVGLPLDIVLGITAIIIIPWFWPLVLK